MTTLGNSCAIIRAMRSEWLILLAFLLSAPATAPAAAPAAPPALSGEETDEVATHLIGNSLFVLFHEIGHALIDLYQLPVLGREEDAVDNLATLTMVPDPDDEDHALGDLLLAAAEGWYLAHEETAETIDDLAFWDEHGLNLQRYYSIVCLLYGSDPERYGEMAEEVELPVERRRTCPKEYEQVSNSWDTLLAPHLVKDDRRGETIRVVYGDATGALASYAALFKKIGVMEIVADDIMESFILPEPITIQAATCGKINAFWIPSKKTVVYCYELLAEQQRQIIEDIKQR